MELTPLTAGQIAGAPEWMREIELRPDGWRSADTRALRGTSGGTSVAVGMMWTSRVHDSRYWVAVAVDPACRRRGLGTEMFGSLSALRARPVPFTARGYVDSREVAFARSLGAVDIQTVPPSRVRTADAAALHARAEVCSGASVPLREVAAAHAAIYEWTHASWSPVARGFAAALNEGLADELDMDATSIVVDQHGRPAAMTMVWNDSRPVITGETVGERTPDGERLIEACLHRSLSVLHRRGVIEVEMDGHVTDPHLAPVWARLHPRGKDFCIMEIPAAG